MKFTTFLFRFIGSALAFVAVIAATVAVILHYPRTYQSTAKLLLKLGRESVTLDPTVTTTGETLSLHRTRESEISTTLDTMKSRLVLEEVVKQVGAGTILRGTPSADEEPSSDGWLSTLKGRVKEAIDVDPIAEDEQVIIKLESGLSISAGRDSGVVEVRYRTKSPEVAQQVVSKWIDVYRSLHVSMNETDGATDFFEREQAAACERLASARAALHAAKDRAGLVTVTGQQALLESQILSARQAIMLTKSERSASKARLNALTESLAAIPERLRGQEASVSNRAHELMRDTLFQLEIAEKQLESALNPNHPRLAVVRDQRKEAERILASQDKKTSETTETINPLYQNIEQQLLEEQANQASLSEQLGTQEQQFVLLMDESKTLNRLEQEIAKCESDVAVLHTSHNTLVEKLEQARLASALQLKEIGSINTVQPASFETRPASPRKSLCAVLGLFAACCAALGVQLLQRAWGAGKKTQEPLPKPLVISEATEITKIPVAKTTSVRPR